MNILTSFADFNGTQLSLTEQQFNDYKSKYLDIYDKVRRDNSPERSSILNDVDFEIELLHRDEISVAYILTLLSGLNDSDQEQYNGQLKNIIGLITNDINLRSKRQLIEEFIEENLPNLNKLDNVSQSFQDYWEKKKQKAFDQLCDEENLNKEKFQQIIDTYLFANRLPRKDEAIKALNYKPRILDLEITKNRLMDKTEQFINTFIDGMGCN